MPPPPRRIWAFWFLTSALHLAGPAAANNGNLRAPHAALRGDLLEVVSAGGERFEIPLGPVLSLYDPPRASERTWRRAGSTEETDAAVLVRKPRGANASAPLALAHVVLLWEDGVLEMRVEGGRWAVDAQAEAAMKQRRLQAFGGTRWLDCWPGRDQGLRQIRVGLACDRGYSNRQGGVTQTETALEEIMSATNLVYENQLGAHLAIGRLVMGDPAQGATDWARQPLAQQTQPCSSLVDMNQQLNEFRDVSRALFDTLELGTWMLMTDCFPPPGVIGLAWVGTLCNPSHNYGVTTHTSNTWLTYAHELGHLFGGGHSFEDGKGSTGGIMDYGNGYYENSIQFHPYRKQELCGLIDRTMNQPSRNEVPNCWTTYNPEDREGTWEPGEWSLCDVSCKFNPSDGVQFKEPRCMDFRGALIPDRFCKNEKEPIEFRPCDPAPANCQGTVRWKHFDWGECTNKFQLNCGAGREEKRPRCVDSSDQIQQGCDGETPAAIERACHLPENCTEFSQWVQDFEESGWDASPTCVHRNAQAYQTRRVFCADVINLQTVDNIKCFGPRILPEFRQAFPGECQPPLDSCCTDAPCRSYKDTAECLDKARRLDGIACLTSPSSGTHMYRFLGGYYRKESRCNFNIDPVKVGKISDAFPGLPSSWTRMDAVLAGPSTSGELLFFRGSEVFHWSTQASRPRNGYRTAQLIKDVFPGICAQCEAGITAAMFDEVAQIFRVWCGTGDAYCRADIDWSKKTTSSDWMLRPSQDFGLPEVHSVVLDGTDGGFRLMGIDGRNCNVAAGALQCTNVGDSPTFARTASGELECAKLPNCLECQVDSQALVGKKCTTCEEGFRLLHDSRCVHYQARFWSFDPIAVDGNPVRISGAKDQAEYTRWVEAGVYMNDGPFDALRALRADSGLQMAAVMQDDQQTPAVLRKWSLNLWVRGRDANGGTLLEAPQQNGNGPLRLTWGSCGPSIQYTSDANQTWYVNCDEDLENTSLLDEWAQVTIRFQENIDITVNSWSISTESNLGEVTLENWTIGGFGMDIGYVEVLDHEIWPSLQWNFTLDGYLLFGWALVLTVLSVWGIRRAFRVPLQKGQVLQKTVCIHRLLEGYIIIANIVICAIGTLLAAGVLWFLALQGLGLWGLINTIPDVFIGQAFDIQVLLYPFWGGVVMCLGGLIGIRSARTRDALQLLIYLILLLASTGLIVYAAATFAVIDLGNINVENPADPWLGAGQEQLLFKAYEYFDTLMGSNVFGCDVTTSRAAQCSETSFTGQMIYCEQPKIAARVFQNAVNEYCPNFENITVCGTCATQFGQWAGIADWNPVAPTSRVWCKCLSQMVDRSTTVLQLQYASYLAAGLVILLLGINIYFLMCVPAKRKMFQHDMNKQYQLMQIRLGYRQQRSNVTSMDPYEDRSFMLDSPASAVHLGSFRTQGSRAGGSAVQMTNLGPQGRRSRPDGSAIPVATAVAIAPGGMATGGRSPRAPQRGAMDTFTTHGSSYHQDEAAVRIQALQRGRQVRVQSAVTPDMAMPPRRQSQRSQQQVPVVHAVQAAPMQPRGSRSSRRHSQRGSVRDFGVP